MILVIADFTFNRNRSKKVELLAKLMIMRAIDTTFGFCAFTLGWSDGSTLLSGNSILLSMEKK